MMTAIMKFSSDYSLRLFRNSEAFASEFLESLEEMFSDINYLKHFPFFLNV